MLSVYSCIQINDILINYDKILSRILSSLPFLRAQSRVTTGVRQTEGDENLPQAEKAIVTFSFLIFFTWKDTAGIVWQNKNCQEKQESLFEGNQTPKGRLHFWTSAVGRILYQLLLFFHNCRCLWNGKSIAAVLRHLLNQRQRLVSVKNNRD